MRRNDPRIRQTLNQISETVDSAQYTTRASLFAFHQTYLVPCFAGFSTCLESSCAPCYTCITKAAAAASSAHPASEANRRRRNHGRRRGREELSFDFYDDWAAEEEEGWGNDELDRLLAGNEPTVNDVQPGRRKGMNYGGIAPRRKGGEEDLDTNVVPKSAVFGFLERLPWKIGGRGRRYKPSAADLQDVGEGRRKPKIQGEDEPLISESESGGEAGKRGHGRKRSGTVGSRETTTSLSSRGDLFPSEDEDDAVPLDDEFAMVLARRNTQGTLSDDNSKSRAASARTKSSRSPGSIRTKRRRASDQVGDVAQVPSMSDLKEEEERVRAEEDENVGKEREAARKLAAERGLLNPDGLRVEPPPPTHAKDDASVSIHPVPSHHSETRNDREASTESEEQAAHNEPISKPPDDGSSS